MNQEEIQQKIAQYYQKLPAEAQEIFSSMTWLETLKEISARYNLNDQQIQTLGTETMLVLLGIIDLNEYERVLINEINLPKYSMDEMVIKINDSILKNIRPQLMKTFERNNQEDEEKSTKKEDLDIHFNNLSTETKEAIKESDYQNTLYSIGKKNNLTVSQMGILEEIMIKVMSGIIPNDQFKDSLKDLNLDNEKILGLIEEINEKIFKVIREKLKEKINLNKVTEMEPEVDSLETKFENQTIESREDMLKKISVENIPNQKDINTQKIEEIAPSVLSQKLSSNFQTEQTKSDHSLPSMQTGSKINRVDPYREPTE